MSKSPRNLSWFMAGAAWAPSIERTEPSLDPAELDTGGTLEVEPDYGRPTLFCDLPESYGKDEQW